MNAGEVVEAVLKLKGPEGLSQVVQEAFKRSPELLPEEPAQSLSADLSNSPTHTAISYPTRERRPPQRLSPTGSALAGNQSVSTDLGSSPQTVPDVIADIRWHLGTKTSREQAEQLYQAVQLARREDADPSNATLEILANLGFHGKAAVRKVHKVLEVVKANDDYQGPDDTNSMTSSSTNTTCRTTTEEPTPSRTPASLTTWLQAPSTSSPGPGSRPPRSSPWRSLPSTPWPARSSPITDSTPASTQPSVKRATPPTDPRSPVKVPQPTKRSWDTSNKDYDVDISGAVAVQDQARFDIAVERKHDSRRRDPHELTRGSRRKDT